MASPTAREPGMGLPGMGSVSQGLDQTFISTVTGILSRNVKNLPRFLPRNFIWVGVLAGLWLLLHSYPTHKLPAVGSLLVFLTAAYNNFIAKALYIGAVNTVIIPRIAQARELGIGKVFGAYARLAGPVTRAFGLLGMKAIQVGLMSLGAGIAISNALTRNNATDKYFICVLSAFWLLDALTQGAGSMPVRLFRAAYRDITKRAPTYELIYASFTAAAVGLLLGFLPGMIGSRSYWDYKGYIIGAVVMGLGFAAGFAGGKDAGQRT